VSEAILASEYEIRWQERTGVEGASSAWHAPNRAHGFRTYFTESGVLLLPRVSGGPGWVFKMELAFWGRGESLARVGAGSLSPSGNRIEYWRPDVVEWYVNDRRGLEQAFKLAKNRPADPLEDDTDALEKSGFARFSPTQHQEAGPSDPVYLVLVLSGDLSPRISPDRRSAELLAPDGRAALRYGSLRAFDARGEELPAWMEGFADAGVRGIRLVVDDRDAVYPVTVDPLTTNPTWTAESDQVSARLGMSVATAGDVNGDGFSDVLVGVPYFDNGQTDEGRALLFLGSSAGLSTTPAWTAESDQASALFGISVSTAGDVNGDGFSDILVGASQYTNGQSQEGRVFVYHGSATGPSAAANWTAESDQANARLGFAVATAADVNGDGFSDILVGAREYESSSAEADEGRVFVWYGSSTGLGPNGTPSNADWFAESNQAGAFMGISVATAGDVNGDGYADVLVGAHRYESTSGQSDEGRAFLWLGGPSGLGAPGTPSNAAWFAEADQAQAQLGRSVGTAGDVNGDGYADVIIGAYQYTDDALNQPNEGQAFVWMGGPSGLGPSGTPSNADWAAGGNQASAFFGISVGTAGDVNGDGYADVIVGAYSYDAGQTDEGRAFVYYGSASGLSQQADWTGESDQAGALYGFSVAGAGDVNGDGYADVIVGAYQYDNGQTDEGRAFAYHGSASGLAPAPGWTAEPDQSQARFGWSVASAGDVNGDGFADVIVGAPFYDNGQTDEGRAFVYHGSASGLAIAPSWTAESDQAGAQFGASVAGAGDVNGDGYADVIVGAPFYDNGQTDEGRAFLYRGSASGLETAPSWTAESNQTSARFGASVAGAGDVNGDGYADALVGAPLYDNGQTDEGRAFAFYGQAAGLGTAAAWTAESNQTSAQFGASVAGAGDVNRDGFSDVLVGAPLYDNGQADEGRAFVYHGSSSGLGTAASWTGESDQAGAQFGASVAGAADVNDDGYSDVLVGAPLYDNGQTDEGRAFAWYGGAGGLGASGTPANADWSAESNQASARFGASVASAGDVDGDGISDAVVGAPGFDNPEADEGSVFLYRGSSTGLAPSASFSSDSNDPSSSYGTSVSSAGDVNGDGYGDILVGADLFDAGQTDEGRVFLFYGNERRGVALKPQQRRADDTAPVGPLGYSSSPDQFRLAAAGRTPFGPGRLKLQWEVEQLGTSFDGAGLQSSAGWIASGASGAALNELVTGLTVDRVYHWRLRLRYEPASVPFAPGGRWLAVPSNGRQEADLRTVQPAGRVPRDLFLSGTMLRVDKAALGDITVSWAPSCLAGDTDYEIYEGTIGSFPSHAAKFCTTGGATSKTFTPQSASAYYLVVPRNASREGSYGAATRGERFRGSNACLPQAVAACP